MATHSRRDFIALSVAAVGVLADLRAVRARDDKEIPPTEAAKTQADALKLARTADLPALEKADHAVIEEVAARGGKKVTVSDNALKGLRQALVLKDTPPSAGKTAWTITFYRGEKAVRKVWVYPSGEWGVERPAAPHWTLGSNKALAEKIERIIQGAG